MNEVVVDSSMIVDVCFLDSVELSVRATGTVDSVLWFRDRTFKGRGIRYEDDFLPVGIYRYEAHIYRTNPDTGMPYFEVWFILRFAYFEVWVKITKGQNFRGPGRGPAWPVHF